MWVHCQRSELNAAQEHLDQLLGVVAQMGIPEATLRAPLYQARLHAYRGRVDQAGEWFGRAEALMQSRPAQGLLAAEWIAFRGQCYLWQGDLKAAAGLLEAQGVKASDLDGPHAPGSESLRALAPRLVAYGFLARVLVAQGVSRRADALLEQVCLMAEAIPNLEVLLQALALRAVVAGSIHGDATRGLPYLERALSLAAPENFARPFLDAGGALAKPLRQAIMQGIQPAFAQKLLVELAEEERKRALHGHMPGVSGTPAKARASGGMSRFIEPLTERERQALRLLAAGLTSTEVAKELVISVATARSYIKSLYGKLDAHSREEVVERGRQAGLL
jgi:LuxR family maltose regulon positive regulatory protein